MVIGLIDVGLVAVGVLVPGVAIELQPMVRARSVHSARRVIGSRIYNKLKEL